MPYGVVDGVRGDIVGQTLHGREVVVATTAGARDGRESIERWQLSPNLFVLLHVRRGNQFFGDWHAVGGDV